jgi:hemerythrin-like domain-containing protein
MTKPLDDLKHEHRLIERVLAVLERVTEQLERNEKVSPEILAQGLEFVRGFADGCHHAKEEHGLFPTLASKSPTIEGGPVRVLTADHDAGRKLMRDLEHGIEAMRGGRPEGASAARQALRTYTHMLRRHIAKEEEILFPLSEGLLTDEDEQALEAHFERVEAKTGAGAHERFEALVRGLEETVGAVGR